MTTEAINASPPRNIFFGVIPTAAIAFAVAALVPPAPRSIPIIIILALTAVILRVSAWITYTCHSIVNKDQASRDEVRRMHSNGHTLLGDVRSAGVGNNTADERVDTRSVDNGSDNGSTAVSSVGLYNILQALMRPSRTVITLLYASSFTFIMILLIRLFSVSNFGGRPHNLDYGPKISKNKPAGDTNIAMENFDFDTSAHLIQGLLAAFLSFPAVTGFLSNIATKMIRFVRILTRRSSSHSDGDVDGDGDTSSSTGTSKNMGCVSSIILEKPCLVTLSICQLLCTCLTYYPFYSMVKRLRYSSFAQSSHTNNTTEWCSGFILGISLGSLASSLILHQFVTFASDEESRSTVIHNLTVIDDEENGTKTYGFGKASDFKQVMKYSHLFPLVEYASLGNLILFSVTTLLTGINFGLSWNYEEDNTVNGGILALYICLYAVSYSIFFILARWN